MEVLNLSKIERIDETAIYYLRTYNATAKIRLPIKDIDLLIHFTLENTPFGTTNIDIKFDKNIDYPILPLEKKLKSYIIEADSEGILPC